MADNHIPLHKRQHHCSKYQFLIHDSAYQQSFRELHNMVIHKLSSVLLLTRTYYSAQSQQFSELDRNQEEDSLASNHDGRHHFDEYTQYQK